VLKNEIGCRFLFIRRVAILAQHTLDRGPQFGTYRFLDRPVDGHIGANALGNFTGNEVQVFVAENLAWKLAAVLSGDLPDHLLDTYEAERKPHARAMIRLAKLVGTVMTGGGEFGKRARRLVAPRLHYLPGVRQHVLDSRTPPLRRTALVARPRLGRSLAGQLCPNAAVDGTRRFDDLAAGRFALVTATAPTPAQRCDIERRGAVVVTATPGSELHRWLGRGRAAIVRPDGTVQRTGRAITTLIKALTPA
jgi:3-(3-hydroxy-phenyl)propionate hydroxylase